MAEQRPFRSPLLRGRRDPLNQLRFGTPAPDHERESLRERLDASLRATVAVLPGALRDEAAALLEGYGAGKLTFIGLFYSPTWSFLAERPLADEQRSLAERVQAHALLLHLWDDHLCDGQLAPDLVRLHLRTIAWGQFEAGARALARLRGHDEAAVDAALERYFGSLVGGGRAAVGDLDAYLDRFRDEVAIWTLVPALVDGSSSLVTAVEHFSVAWRLLDDIQDTHEDLLADHHSAVWWACDDAQRSVWAAGREAQPQAWADLLLAFDSAGLVSGLLRRIRDHLRLAHDAAIAANCPKLAADLTTMALGLGEFTNR
jgi:hypothetical protein